MTFEEYVDKYTAHHAEATSIAALMLERQDAALIPRANRMLACGTVVDGQICVDCGQFHVRKTSLCRDRLCPNCGYVLTRKRAGLMYRALQAVNEQEPIRVNHVVLTLPHTARSNLRTLMQTLTQGYGRMMRGEYLQPYVLGSARGIEISRSGENGYHPHIHALMVEDARDVHLSQDLLLHAWRDATGCGDITQVSCTEAYDGHGRDDTWEAACMEAVKYAMKPGALLLDGADDIAEFADAVRRFRLHSTDGVIKSALQWRFAAEDTKRECPDCHSTRSMDRAWMRWNMDAGTYEVYDAPHYL